MPRFAAVVPSHNRAELLAETLGSLLPQHRPFDQIVVVDDGSTDGTLEMLAQRFPTVVRIGQSRSYVQAARNAGVAASDAEWISFCDSDDLLDPAYLVSVAALIDRHPALDVIYTDHISSTGEGTMMASKLATAPPGYWNGTIDDGGSYLVGGSHGGARVALDLCCRIIAFQTPWPTGMAARRSFFERLGGFDPAISGIRGEDTEFCCVP